MLFEGMSGESRVGPSGLSSGCAVFLDFRDLRGLRRNDSGLSSKGGTDLAEGPDLRLRPDLRPDLVPQGRAKTGVESPTDYY
jgi:hypothetical protein